LAFICLWEKRRTKGGDRDRRGKRETGAMHPGPASKRRKYADVYIAGAKGKQSCNEVRPLFVSFFGGIISGVDALFNRQELVSQKRMLLVSHYYYCY
jgi:hypothetical protein